MAHHDSQDQRGIALLVALFMLIAILLVGVSAARTALESQQNAQVERDHAVAMQAAEAALADAERDIEGGIASSARGALFADGSAAGFDAHCGTPGGPNQGLCLPAPPDGVPVWQRIDLADGSAASTSVAYGSFTGASMQTGAGPLPVRLPRYLIELLPLALSGEGADGNATQVYRITAIGFGMRETTRVVLQSLYRKLSAHAPPVSDEGRDSP